MANYAPVSWAPMLSHSKRQQLPSHSRKSIKCTWHITTQDAINSLESLIDESFGACESPSIFTDNATGRLAFSDLSVVGNIVAHGNPGLEALDFPNLRSLYNVVPRSNGTHNSFGDSLQTAGQLLTDSCMSFNSLEHIIEILTLDGTAPNCNILPSLNSVKDSDRERDIRFPSAWIYPSLRRSIAVASFDPVSNINSNLSITTSWNLNVTFNSVTSIGSTLSAFNNINCTFSFEELASAANIVLLDNVDSIIPSFPSLQTARNIHMRGYIDTSNGYNIFPSLARAPGSVVIEPWNTDFDCSTLVAQQQNLVINQLSCSGINNGTNTSTATPLSPTGNPCSGLSTGARAGIGAASGVLGIGLVTAAIWLHLY
ncbi:hypothetical protein GGR57DRAFT_507019 [Xylariaceae sp. FL1272]|nr:hypothetical protein GGR57DRAFT_507019 [Xylariaceae sp. FL1272]